MLTIKSFKNEFGERVRINESQFLLWLEALRSGKYKQSSGQLQSEYGYCCLGVACKVIIPDEKIEMNESKEVAEMYGEFPSDQEYAPNWLRYINEDFEKRFGYSLAQLNDGEEVLHKYNNGYNKDTSIKITFKVLADLLEAVYIGGCNNIDC